jgi:hypothetical protein
MNIYANSLTNGDIISQNTLMYAKKSSDTYTTLDNTGAAIIFAENYSSSPYGKMLFERNSIGFNEQWDAKSTMDHPAVDIGANWYFGKVFGLNLEFGYPFSKFGVTFKF